MESNKKKAKKRVTKTISIDVENVEVWENLTNKSNTVNLLLKFAKTFGHPDDINAKLRSLAAQGNK